MKEPREGGISIPRLGRYETVTSYGTHLYKRDMIEVEINRETGTAIISGIGYCANEQKYNRRVSIGIDKKDIEWIRELLS